MKSISEQQKIIDAATPGPWSHNLKYITVQWNGGYVGLFQILSNIDPNAALVCESRTEYPELLDWAKRARSYVDRVKMYSCECGGDDRDCGFCREADGLLAELPE